MKDSALRKMLMLHGPVIRRLLPTETQRKVFMVARVLGDVTVEKIATKFKISTENASAQLKALRDKGYLKRKKVEGVYTYSPARWS